LYYFMRMVRALSHWTISCQVIVKCELWNLTDHDDFKSTFDGLEILSHQLVLIPVNDNSNIDAGGGSHW
jgi:hypothetical protein